MFLKIRLTLNQELLDSLKGLKARQKRIFKTKLRTEFAPELQQEVDALMQDAPGAVSDPFAFGSEPSRRYYHALIRENPDLVDDEHWIRRGELESAWRPQIMDRIGGDMIRVVNIQRQSTGTKPYPANYVYGPWNPLGHTLTGWPAQAAAARIALREKAIARIIQLRREAVREAARGRDD